MPLSILTYQQEKVRHEVKEMIISGLSADDLTKLKFHKDDAHEKLEWEHEKEFKFQGEKYDVVQTSVTDDSITYYCWWDHEETAIEQQLADSLQKALSNDLESQKGKRTLISYLKVDYQSPDGILLAHCPFSFQQDFHTNYIRSHTSILSTPPTPPPDHD